MFFNQSQQKTLIVVCKDELLTNQLKKYVETNDDVDEENIVGTKDGSVKIVAWSEKVWLDNKKAGNIASKVLLIGDIKGSDKLIPIIDVKYNEFGIKYGWAGNQAIITVDPKALSKESNYNAFFEALQKTAVSETFQQNVKTGKETKTEVAEATKENVEMHDEATAKENIEEKQNKNKNILLKIGRVVAAILTAGGSEVIITNVSNFGNNEKVEKQQFVYGITKLYENHLAEFLR